VLWLYCCGSWKWADATSGLYLHLFTISRVTAKGLHRGQVLLIAAQSKLRMWPCSRCSAASRVLVTSRDAYIIENSDRQCICCLGFAQYCVLMRAPLNFATAAREVPV
jgi:hypothetical protein